MKIESVETTVCEAFYRRPFVIAGGKSEMAVNVLVRIHGEDGNFGVGESAPMPAYSGQTSIAVKDALDHHLIPAIIGMAAFDLERIHEAMDRALLNQPIAKAAIDLALHDLMGRAWGVPVYALLGGKYRRKIPLAWAVGLGTLEEVIEESQQQVHKGFGTIKLKIGLDPERDLEVVARAREVLGPRVAIRVDANQGYDFIVAWHTLRRMERYELQLIEQPVPRWDIDGMVALKSKLDTPIMADESLYSPNEAIHLIKRGAADIFNIKLMKCGGLFPARRIAAIAAAAGIPCMVGSMPELGVGTAAGIHFAAATAAVCYPCELIGPLMFERDVIADTLYSDETPGYVSVPDRVGLGIDLEMEEDFS